MADDRLAQVLRVVEEALAREGAARAAYLDAACGTDTALRAEVESVLARRSQDARILESPAWKSEPRAPLAAGTRLGPYEIERLLGAGGMGEVYKARDSRLGRTVAVKVLPPGLAADPERRRRFEHEAKAIAALSHPHICTLHDIGQAGGVDYLVMELLEGQTLAARLEKGALPPDHALAVAIEIAEALAAAHRQGVVHRDLKPANVMLTKSGAKLLDFGLAKLRGHGEQAVAASLAPTAAASSSLTAAGTLIGTLPYMAPEQLEGKPVDARTDIWALGTVLYEMVTGQRAFAGDSQASLITAIMSAEPPALATLKPLTPASLDRLVRRCLSKAPDDRPDTAHDVADELRGLSGVGTRAGAGGASSGRRALWTGVSVVAVGLVMAAAGAAVMWKLRPAPAKPTPVRLTMDVRPADELNAGGIIRYIQTPGGSRTALTWTPDGRALVFAGRRAGVQQLYVRSLDAAEARPLANTEGAQVPAVSPDGEWVAFWAKGVILKVRIEGSPATELAKGVVTVPWGMVWDDKGSLYFGRESIWVIRPGGQPEEAVERTAGERVHAQPFLLPGGRVLLYTLRRGWYCWGDEEVIAYTFATKQKKRLMVNAADARYVPTGHLLFMRMGVLYAAPFDPDQLELRGPEVAVSGEIPQALISSNADDASGAGQYAVSSAGVLAWITGPVPDYLKSQVIAVDRRGQETSLALPAQAYGQAMALSPDGRRLALSVRSLARDSLMVYDLGSGASIPLTEDGEANWPVWSPDGRSVVFGWTRKGVAAPWMRVADGSGPPQQLIPPIPAGKGGCTPSSFSPSGVLAAVVGNRDAGRDIFVGPIENGQARLEPLLNSAREESHPEFSPDGRWLAYVTDRSGRPEVHVQPYPGPGPAVPISVGGGVCPAWHPNGREILFWAPTVPPGGTRMMAVDFVAGSPPGNGRPRELFKMDRSWSASCGTVRRRHAVSPDGQWFYFFKAGPVPPQPVVTQVHILQHWFEELKAKAPVR